ncbi:hypothetical protein Hanom_Chr03g00218931 [Helianthus anomalus]
MLMSWWPTMTAGDRRWHGSSGGGHTWLEISYSSLLVQVLVHTSVMTSLVQLRVKSSRFRVNLGQQHVKRGQQSTGRASGQIPGQLSLRVNSTRSTRSNRVNSVDSVNSVSQLDISIRKIW